MTVVLLRGCGEIVAGLLFEIGEEWPIASNASRTLFGTTSIHSEIMV
jgi:hypothetical protein